MNKYIFLIKENVGSHSPLVLSLTNGSLFTFQIKLVYKFSGKYFIFQVFNKTPLSACFNRELGHPL